MAAGRTQSRDTSPEAEAILLEAWRRLPSWDKAERLSAMTRDLHELTLAGLRQRHPGASERELWLLAARLRLGDELADRLGLPRQPEAP